MKRRWWILVAVSLATFMTYLDNNVTNVAIPTIEHSLHLSIAGVEWVVSSYILVFASLLLAGGRLADLYGRRRLFLAGLGVFTAASLWAGLATSGAVLIAARLVQGLGAALVVPTTLAIIMATFTDTRERTRAIGTWTAIGAMALAFGPLIGGYISQHLHWGWIFFINVPIGLIESRSREPMVDVRLFRSRVFGGGTAVMMVWAFGILGIYFFTSIYLQTILGFSPTEAGLAFVPMAICMAAFASLAPQLTPRLGAHRTVGIGMAVMAVGLYLVARLGGGATFAGLMPGFLIFGAGAGLMNVPLTNAVLHSMPTERSGIASALMNASRELAGLLGITVIGAVLRTRQGDALRHGASPGAAFLHGYHDGLLVTVVLLAVGAVLGWVALRRSATDHTRPEMGTVLAAELAPEDLAEMVPADLAGLAPEDIRVG